MTDAPSECHCWLGDGPPFGLAPVRRSEGPAEANYITGHSSVCLCDRDTTEPQMHRARHRQSRVTRRKTLDIKGAWGEEGGERHVQTQTCMPGW